MACHAEHTQICDEELLLALLSIFSKYVLCANTTLSQVFKVHTWCRSYPMCHYALHCSIVMSFCVNIVRVFTCVRSLAVFFSTSLDPSPEVRSFKDMNMTIVILLSISRRPIPVRLPHVLLCVCLLTLLESLVRVALSNAHTDECVVLLSAPHLP